MNPTRHGATHAVAELAGATKEYAPGVGITQADLRVHSRSIHALIGLNGAGKTTLMRVLLGMTYLQAGHVRVLGHTNPRSGNAVWAGVGHLVDYPLAYPELTVATCLDIAARLRGLPSRNRAHAVEAAIEEFGLTPYRSVRVGRLSQGNRQRLGLAIALHHHPQFVVLDEPTNALDPGGMITLRQVLSQRAEAGAGILVSTHHLDEVSRIAHTITMINRGRIIGQLDPAASGLERAFFDAIYDDDRRHGWISS